MSAIARELDAPLHAAMMKVERLGDTMGALISGLDLRSSIGHVTAAALARLLDEHAVLCVRGQTLEPAMLLAFARVFGTPEPQLNRHLRVPGYPEVGVLSAQTRDVHGTLERVINGTTWHTDHSFLARPPKATLLHALEIPPNGGNTSFCDMRAAYAALASSMRRRIEALRAVHCYQSSRSPRRMMARTREEEAETPDVVHPLVRTYLPAGGRALYMSTTRLERIEGLTREASDALIEELLAHATQDHFLYHHQWQPGDVVIWDNRCTMHHANADYPMDATRTMHRVLIAGEVPT